jgi:hypothetical protein
VIIHKEEKETAEEDRMQKWTELNIWTEWPGRMSMERPHLLNNKT